jgi:Ser/Thr protein kinase RdoA (MazF antagonist)
MLKNISEAYNLHGSKMESFGTGLINRTWKITDQHGNQYILQKINENVFKNPGDIAFNIKLIGDHLKQKHPYYFFVRPVPSASGEEMIHIEGEGFFRLFPFVENSHTIDVVNTTEQAYEAAKQFGKFTQALSGFDSAKLKTTIPDFHNLQLRYHQFEKSIQAVNKKRINNAKKLIEFLILNKIIADEYSSIINDPEFKQRVTHHDTKISNVLFDKNDKAICIIDLDTVMPGYFISDVGDMMRTYLSPVSEEEKDPEKIVIREDYYYAIENGYMEEMSNELSEKEKNYFFYSGKFMIYMQALRFLTDHLENDKYYGAKYEGHNYVRAYNQVILLERLMEKETEFSKMI